MFGDLKYDLSGPNKKFIKLVDMTGCCPKFQLGGDDVTDQMDIVFPPSVFEGAPDTGNYTLVLGIRDEESANKLDQLQDKILVIGENLSRCGKEYCPFWKKSQYSDTVRVKINPRTKIVKWESLTDGIAETETDIGSISTDTRAVSLIQVKGIWSSDSQWGALLSVLKIAIVDKIDDRSAKIPPNAYARGSYDFVTSPT